MLLEQTYKRSEYRGVEGVSLQGEAEEFKITCDTLDVLSGLLADPGLRIMGRNSAQLGATQV